MVTTDTKATPDLDVLSTELQNGEAVLLHLGTKTYYSLNDTGLRIWQLLSKGLTLNEISQELEAEFDVTLKQAQDCVFDLTNQLVAEELVRFTT